MSQLPLQSLDGSSLSPGRAAPLIHKWFARRRPDAIQAVLKGLTASGDDYRMRIMDPFAGSGMILLECLAQGHDVFGADINPVAWLIARQTLNPPDIAEVRQALERIDEAVGPEIRKLFRTTTPNGVHADVVTGFYVRVVKTPEGGDLELHHNYLIARNKRKNWAVYYCPVCGAVFASSCLNDVTCLECQSEFDWRQGPVVRGKVEIGAKKVSLADIYAKECDGPRFKLIAVESFSPETGRLYHRPSSQDLKNVEMAKSRCLHHDIARNLSATLIPINRRDPRPISHGFKSYGDLFAPRQLLALSLITDAIKNIEEEDLKYAMALALSDTAGNNNRMCRYAADWLKLTPAFGLHGFDVVTRPVEGNVWGAARGRGSFSNCVAKATRAYAAISSTIDQLESSRKNQILRDVRCMPAQELSEIGWKTMDAIVTDPPYFDNLDYGELGDFYYQWLRVALDGASPFDGEHSLKASDLARIAAVDKDPSRFSTELSKTFRQAAEHLGSSGVVTFSYHHAKSQAWECLSDALRGASIVPYKLRFVRSELDNGFHSSSGNIKIDSIFYCRQRDPLEEVNSDGILSDALDSLSELEDLKPVDLASAAYAIATALAVLHPSGGFADSLSRVRQIARWD